MTSVNGVERVVYAQPQKHKGKKTHVATATLGLAGTAVGAFAANDAFAEFNNLRLSEVIMESYKKGKTPLTEAEYLNRYLKNLKIVTCGKIATTMVFCVTAGLAIGTLVDGIINAVKKNN